MTIWKYKLRAERNEIDVPKGAAFLSVSSQPDGPEVFPGASGEDIVVYALVDPEAETEKRVLQVVGTGGHLEFRKVECPAMMFLGTAKLKGSIYMFHVFERERA